MNTISNTIMNATFRDRRGVCGKLIGTGVTPKYSLGAVETIWYIMTEDGKIHTYDPIDLVLDDQ